MSDTPIPEFPTMRLAVPEDEITMQFALPCALVSETESGLELRTCRGGVISVPRSILSPNWDYTNAVAGSTTVTVIQIQTRRDIGELLGNLIAEIVRLSR